MKRALITGVITDTDGKFKITVRSGSVLLFSFLGMKQAEYTITSSDPLNIVMEPEAMKLDELIVIGYGSKKKRDIIGSVSSITSDELVSMPATSLTNAMQGKAAGVQVSNSSGVPGSQVEIKVRGENSIS
ncbi:MAG: TonB-dependent receptor plug domain-containing protein, partial [Bacteroidales bacterium]|nr:TonB-dependent receptor plug domain-containing protein [Bacteroidales bacterium]